MSDADVLTIAANLAAAQPPAKAFQEWNALEFFREEARQHRLTPLEASKFLREVVTALDDFLRDPRHRAICRVKQPRVLAAPLLLSKRFKNDKDSRAKALFTWENAMFRSYVLAGWDARDRIGDCIRLAAEIYTGNLSLKQIVDRLDEIANITYSTSSYRGSHLRMNAMIQGANS